jgi:GAF domain-containing protein
MGKKKERYERLFQQIEALVTKHNNPLSTMATIVAVLQHKMKSNYWTGFYLLKDGELYVGPYQGTLACIHLKKDTGVCWAGINQKETVIVPNVHDFPGHIACDSKSNSEIVVPIVNKEGEIVGVLDVDSLEFNSFDENDKEGLEKIVSLVYQ